MTLQVLFRHSMYHAVTCFQSEISCEINQNSLNFQICSNKYKS